MADKKIRDLNELTTLANADELIVSDTSSSETKKITITNFKSTVGLTSAHTIQNNGTGLTQRNNLNFDGTHVVATDDSGNNQTDVALSSNLQALSGLTSAADKGIQYTGSGTAGVYSLTTAGRALLDDANASAQRTTLGLAIGTNVQAHDADLTAIAGLTSAADKGIQFTGSGTAGVYDLTTAGKALLDDANVAAQRTTLGLGALATEASVTTSQVAAGTLVTEAEGIASNDNDTTIPTSAAVKALVDAGHAHNQTAHSDTTISGTPADNELLAYDTTSSKWINQTIAEVGLAIGTNVQAYDADLTAIAGLTSAADKGIQYTGSGTAGVYDLTTAGKALLDDANASAQRTTLGLAIGTNVQAYDADLTAIAGLTSAADKGIQFTGSGTAGMFDITTAGKALIDDANASAQRTTLGLAIGTNVQAHDADLAAIAGLTSAADKGIQFTGSGTAGVYDLTTAGKALLDDANASAQRTTLGLGSLATLSTVSTTNISDITVASSAAGQALMYDGSDSYDNKQIKVYDINTAFTSAFPMFPLSHIFHVSAAADPAGFTFQYYNSDGTNQAEPDLKLWADQTYAFYLAYASATHPFQIVTGGSDGSAGTVLANGNGARGMVHVATDGTVSTGTGANTKYSGWLIWRVPHFSANSTGTYGYQCSAHANMYGDISLYVVG